MPDRELDAIQRAIEAAKRDNDHALEADDNSADTGVDGS